MCRTDADVDADVDVDVDLLRMPQTHPHIHTHIPTRQLKLMDELPCGWSCQQIPILIPVRQRLAICVKPEIAAARTAIAS